MKTTVQQVQDNRQTLRVIDEIQKELREISQDTSTGFGVGYMKATYDIYEIISKFRKREAVE